MSDDQVIEESEESPHDLRKQVRDRDAELANLRATVQRQAIQAAGFDPAVPVVGMLAREYAKQADADWSKDAFVAYAKTQGYEAPKAETTTAGEQQAPVPAPPTGVQQLSAEDLARMGAQQRVDAVNAATQPATQPSLRQQIDVLESEGKFDEADVLKDQWMTALREGRQVT